MPKQIFTAVKLHFGRSVLHLAKGKEDYDQSEQVLHSDTLKSAIFVAALHLYPENADEDTGKQFLEAISLSSAFPFYGGEYFFPKPMTKTQTMAGMKEDDPKQSKKLKKLSFLGKSYFEDLLNGGGRGIEEAHIHDGSWVSDHTDLLPEEVKDKAEEKPEENVAETTEDLAEKQSAESINEIEENKCPEQPEEKKKEIQLPTSEVGQRVAIPLEPGQDATPFYVDRLFFSDKSGLYFLLDCKDEETLTKVKSALRLLGDMGIGTDRSIGYGQFTVTYEELPLEVPDDTEYQLNLSLFCPTMDELQNGTLNDASYNLLQRGGWVSQADNPKHQTLRKSSVYMFTEGSVFSTSQELNGKIVDLRPKYDGFDHPVWRDGTAIFLPIQPREE